MVRPSTIISSIMREPITEAIDRRIFRGDPAGAVAGGPGGH